MMMMMMMMMMMTIIVVIIIALLFTRFIGKRFSIQYKIESACDLSNHT